MFLAYVNPLGRALVDKGLYLPESWTSDEDRYAAAGVPAERRSYRSNTELALEMLGWAVELGHLEAGWVAADDAFGMSPSFRDALATLEIRYVLDVPAGFTVWPVEPARSSPEYQCRGLPASPGSTTGSTGPWSSGLLPSPGSLGRRKRWPREVRGPGFYRFSTQRGQPSSRRKLGEEAWAVYRRSLDGKRTPLLPVQYPRGHTLGDPKPKPR